MARGFTEREKENIRKSLQEACKRHWTQYGYKKTNVDELCREAGISKGAFYLFFESKEALFCEVLCTVQEEIYSRALEVMEKRKDKNGVAEALKLVYREYDKNNFLYHAERQDYTVFMNKLSKEQAKKIEDANNRNRQLFLNLPYIKFKAEPEMAVSVIYTLIMSIQYKDILPYNHQKTFDFMVDALIKDLYE